MCCPYRFHATKTLVALGKLELVMKLNSVPEAFVEHPLDPATGNGETCCFPGFLRRENAREFAVSWMEAWNSRDLERIIAHYAEDVVFSSPLVPTIGGGNCNTIRGREALRAYLSAALRKFPLLRFRLRTVHVGDEVIVLSYDSMAGLVASEKLKLNKKGQIIRAWVYYGKVKQSNAEPRSRP
jgi:ketosteroid isomerase-like protein